MTKKKLRELDTVSAYPPVVKLVLNSVYGKVGDMTRFETQLKRVQSKLELDAEHAAMAMAFNDWMFNQGLAKDSVFKDYWEYYDTHRNRYITRATSFLRILESAHRATVG